MIPDDVYAETDGWPGLMNALFTASALSRELKADGTAIDKALEAAEIQLCRSDRQAYRLWADAMSADGLVWEPCEAWFDVDCCDASAEGVCPECLWIDDVGWADEKMKMEQA